MADEDLDYINQVISERESGQSLTQKKIDNTDNDEDINAINSVISEKNEKVLQTSLPEDVYNFLYNAAYNIDKTVTETIDFFGPDLVNGLLQEAGIDYRIPTATETFEKYASPPEMQEGLAKDVSTTAAEAATLGFGFAGLLRRAGMMLPSALPGESAALGTARQITNVTPKTMTAEAGLGGASGAGAEIGEEYGGSSGQLAGSIAAPVTAAGTVGLIQQTGRQAVKSVDDLLNMTPSMMANQKIKEEAEAIIHKEAMRSGLTYDEIVERYISLGDKGMIADVAPSFAHAVRTVANDDPKFQGYVTRELQKRQAGQGGRIQDSMDVSLSRKIPEGMSGNVQADLNRLDEVYSPQISEMYQAASSKPLKLSPNLRNMIENPQGYFKQASANAKKALDTKRATGEKISHFDVIDANKKALDDMIGEAARQGKNEKVRDLVKAKNAMLSEVDESIPEYKQARELYAGKASLENAFELGQTFFKPNQKIRDINQEIANMTEMERHYYKLGVKQQVQDIAESENVSRDIVKKYFQKGGTAEKLKILFDDERDYQNFINTLENEMDFGVTKNIVVGNSTTAMQLSQKAKADDSLLSTATDLSTSNIEKGRRILDTLRNKNKMDDVELLSKAKSEAATILTNSGMNPEEVRRIMQQGYEKDLMSALQKALTKPNELAAPLSVGAGAGATASETE